MGRIQIKKNVFDDASGKIRPMLDNCESVRSYVHITANGMTDMDFSGRDALIGELRGIETRLKAQSERIQEFGKAILLVREKLSEADHVSAQEAAKLQTDDHTVPDWIRAVGGSGIYSIVRDLFSNWFPDRSSGSGRHDSDEIIVQPEEIDPYEYPGTPEYNSIHYDHNGVVYNTVPNFSDKVLNQCDYDGPKFRYGQNNWGCTATASAMGMSMITGDYYNPTDDYFWTTHATWNGMQERAWGDQQEMLAEAYRQLTENKRPSVFYAFRPNGNTSVEHAVTIVGVNPDANPDNLTMGDFLVADPDHGKIRNLSELEYNSFIKLLIYNENLP